MARADFDGGLRAWKVASRPTGASAAEAVRAALALGGKAQNTAWVLSEELWTQKVPLSSAQVAGLSPEQLGRALSFEVEPFSGIPAGESIIGFHNTGDGSFDVVEMSRIDRDAIQRAVESTGAKLAGITHPGHAPQDEETLRTWLLDLLPRLQAGSLPLITPPAPAPSPNRFLITGIALGAAALLILFGSAGWTAMQRKDLERRNSELAAASGIRARRVMIFLWAVAGAFCGLGGALLGIKAVVLPELGWELLMPMFAGVILGGIGSPVGAVLGIVTFSIAQEVASLFVGPAYKVVLAFLILLCVLLLRPQGMFGRPIAAR